MTKDNETLEQCLLEAKLKFLNDDKKLRPEDIRTLRVLLSGLQTKSPIDLINTLGSLSDIDHLSDEQKKCVEKSCVKLIQVKALLPHIAEAISFIKSYEATSPLTDHEESLSGLLEAAFIPLKEGFGRDAAPAAV